MKKVLVTGANGLLGQKLVDLYLNRHDVHLIATARGVCRHPQSADMDYREMDITDRDQVMQVVKKAEPSVIIHGAAMTNVDACEKDRKLCDAINVEGTKNLVDATSSLNCHFIFVSTDFVFDGENGPYSEVDEPNPVSYYGNSKLIGERYVQENSNSWAIARTILVYGLVNDMSRSNIVLWAKGALSEGKEIHVVTDQFRSPTLAEDLAMGCMLIEQKEAQGIFNISGKDFMSVYEIVERVAKFYNLPMDKVSKISSESLNQPAKRPPITGFNLSKSRKVLSYEPRSFEAGMAFLEKQLASYSK